MRQFVGSGLGRRLVGLGFKLLGLGVMAYALLLRPADAADGTSIAPALDTAAAVIILAPPQPG